MDCSLHGLQFVFVCRYYVNVSHASAASNTVPEYLQIVSLDYRNATKENRGAGAFINTICWPRVPGFSDR